MYVALTDYQVNRLNAIRRNSIYKSLPLPAFVSVVVNDWLNGGLYLDGDASFSD